MTAVWGAMPMMRIAAGGSVATATATRAAFGTLADGTVVDAVTLAAANGVSARIITYGATLQALTMPDRSGTIADVTLGYDDLAAYARRTNYFGVTVGRYANRIAGGRFTLDGEAYRLTCNDGAQSLHGGTKGFDQAVWRIVDMAQGAVAGVTLAMTSPDGDGGYPGTLDVTVTYALDAVGALTIDFGATTDRPTIVNLTNHAVFNLAGGGSTAGHRLTIPASRYLPVDAALIPTGDVRPVAGSKFDFTRGRMLSDGLRDGRDPQIAAGRGWDHNWVLDKGRTADPEFAARLEDPASGRVLEVLTTEPGLQFYSGNALDGTLIGKRGQLYRMGDGVALEPQLFPDTPNQPAFGSARIDPGTPYRHRMIYRVSVAR